MPKQSTSEKLILVLSLIGMFIFLCGTKACQEDYDLGSQSNVPTQTSTPEDDDDDDTITQTPTSTPTETPEDDGDDDDDDEEGTPTPTATPGGIQAAQDFLTELALLDDKKEENTNELDPATGAQVGAINSDKSANWLGKAFSGGGADSGTGEEGAPAFDSDGDGFTDWLETDLGTDPNDPNSTPPRPRANLMNRMAQTDKDMDGLSDKKEDKYNADPTVNDSDSDGILDGLEVLSGTDPNNSRSRPADSDRDGVGDDLETKRGTNPLAADSDRDGVSDAIEIAINSDPLNPDTDDDGILDGKEYEFGSDPIHDGK